MYVCGNNAQNNLGAIFKILYTKYNKLIVDKGKGIMKYY